ncbi:hypothetical protein MED222_05340 [Vibrio sp. MED222]|nr:hypothetical protein MED222_05340 [Vibrio sp. MED222]
MWNVGCLVQTIHFRVFRQCFEIECFVVIH